MKWILAALALCAGLSANATTWYWMGGDGDLNWFTAANWNSAADGTGDAPTVEAPIAASDSFVFDAVMPSGWMGTKCGLRSASTYFALKEIAQPPPGAERRSRTAPFVTFFMVMT